MNTALKYIVGLLALFTAQSLMADERPQIVAVNYPLAYFAERLIGDDADINFPVPQDVDPSFWRPGIADISAAQAADLILLNGASFATWIDRVSLPRSRLVNTSSALTDAFIQTESITHSHGDGGEHSHEGVASYLWLDPTLAKGQAEAIAAAIARRDLAPANDIYARLERLGVELDALDSATRDSLAPLSDTAMIATHPRYQYFARRNGLTIASLEWDAGAAPTKEELADLTSLMTETDARILIWEAEPPQAALQATQELGLVNVVFPTMVHAPSDVDYLDAFEASVTDLIEAAGQISTN